MSLNDVINDLSNHLFAVTGDGFLLKIAGFGLVLALALNMVKRIMDFFPQGGRHPLLDFEIDDEPKSIIEVPFYSKRRDPDDPIRR